MSYPAIQVANRFIEVAKSNGKPLNSVTKLLKLVYIAHGWYLAITDKPLINEPVEAWKYGPIVRVVYETFRRPQGGNLEVFDTNIDSTQKLDELSERVIEYVYNRYKDTDYRDISILTHMPGSPWDEITSHPNFRFYQVIPTEIIEKYYKENMGR